MSSKTVVILLLVSAVAFATAEPPLFRPRNSRLQQRRSFFARQESVPAAPQPEFAPYPSANELKPESPFQAEEEAAEPELAYGPPDLAYGPPLPATDPLPGAEAPPEFAANPEAEEFARLSQRPARLQQRPKQQRAQLHLVQRAQRLQQRKQPQRAVIKQIVNKPQQTATIRQVVSTQRLVAPIAAMPVDAPAKVVISSERLVAAEPAPFFSTAINTPLGESYVVINSPFAVTSQYQSW